MKNYRTFIKESREHQKIKDICDKYGIENYTINEDGSVDVDGNVDFYNKNIDKLPLKFGEVTGSFDCSINRLKTLEGAPSSVGGYFKCYQNILRSLKGCPSSVAKDFTCSNNKLMSLEGGPTFVGGDYECYGNMAESIKGAPSSVGGNFDCSYNNFTSLVGGPKLVGGNFECEDNFIESLEGGPTRVGGSFRFGNNTLISFLGFPDRHRDAIEVNFDGCPVVEIYKLFQDSKSINLMNEWGVIDGVKMEVSYGALCEVYDDLNMEVPQREDISFKNYTLVD